VNRDCEVLIKALRSMPIPEPRPGFVDRVLANETRAEHNGVAKPYPGQLRHVVARWNAWLGTLWVGAAATLAMLLLRSLAPGTADEVGITLALNEVRDIGVLVESPRDLEGATIRIAVTGSAALDGFGNEYEIGWQTNLQQGGNLISLPVVARRTGEGRLVAVIEHEGRARSMTVNLIVRQAGIS
jgi:hypothetical protein